MAAIVCHSLQSHLESQLVESRTLRLRLPSSKPLPFKPCLWDSNIKTNNHEENNKNNNKIETQKPLSFNPSNNKSSWSFLEAFSNVSTNETSTQYVHPQYNRSSLKLSPRSLELCTESLGSESGSDIVDNEIDMDMNMNMQRKPCKVFTAKKVKAMNFPPPLTTITGSESLRVMPHRENGRLVIEVTKASPMFVSSFHAERSNGRLRLHFLNNHIQSLDPEEEKDVDFGEGFDKEFGNEMHGKMEGVEEGEEEEEEEEDVTYESSGFDEEFENGKGEEVNVNDDCEYDMRMERYERSRRCKENGEHENIEFTPLWVVTL